MLFSQAAPMCLLAPVSLGFLGASLTSNISWKKPPIPGRTRHWIGHSPHGLPRAIRDEIPSGASEYGECEMDNPSGVQANFWQHIYPNFCTKFASFASNSSQEIEGEYTSANYTINPDADGTFSILTPPPNPDMYQPVNGNPWRFDFRFTRDYAANDSCNATMSCSEAMYRISEGPCGRTNSQENEMSAKGRIDVGCGVYSYFIAAPDPDETRCDIPSQYYSAAGVIKSSYFINDSVSAINEFCTSAGNNQTIVQSPPPQRANAWMDQDFAFPEQLFFFPAHDTIIAIFATFAGPLSLENSSLCNNHTSQNFTIGSYAQGCLDILTKTVNRCNDEGSSAQIMDSGGYTIEHAADHGCVVWQIYAYKDEGWECNEQNNCTSNSAFTLQSSRTMRKKYRKGLVFGQH